MWLGLDNEEPVCVLVGACDLAEQRHVEFYLDSLIKQACLHTKE